MSDKQTIEALIERLEKATGPDRELDAEIFIEVTPGVKDAGRIDRDGGVVGWWPKDGPYESARITPDYTSSIDAALTLVPEGAVWTLEASRAWVRILDGDDVSEFQAGFNGREAEATALALCIASLRARISNSMKEGG
jgi:hypothetical protein